MPGREGVLTWPVSCHRGAPRPLVPPPLQHHDITPRLLCAVMARKSGLAMNNGLLLGSMPRMALQISYCTTPP